jgi:hypothetical protein
MASDRPDRERPGDDDGPLLLEDILGAKVVLIAIAAIAILGLLGLMLV